ncbi:MAG TPA: hypothetical protein DCL77_20010 [Prolixibacteraceae bacterium]|nr:hypothetical protein [Prolixibacteraceae bacterium]
MKMKARSLFVYLMLVVFTTISANVWAGNNEPFNSNYKISPDLSFSPNADFQRGWVIAYGESKNPVHVYLKETRKGQEYLVRSNYFEVKYVNGPQGFGVKSTNASESSVSESLNSAVLNQEGLNNQKRFSEEAIGSDKVLDMIASYLPDLLNEQYNSILN